MRLSESTFGILKNFSNINKSLVVKSGNILRTISVTDVIYAEAQVEEDFPIDFGIYELNEFLGGLSIMKDAELIFDNDSYVTIKNGRSKVKYFFCSPSLLKEVPGTIQFPPADVEFRITENDLNSLIRAASVYNLEDISVIGDGSEINIVVRNKQDDTSNTFSVNVGTTSEEFCYNMKVENIKILPGTYDVSVSSLNISKFVNTKMPLTYYIALER